MKQLCLRKCLEALENKLYVARRTVSNNSVWWWWVMMSEHFKTCFFVCFEENFLELSRKANWSFNRYSYVSVDEKRRHFLLVSLAHVSCISSQRNIWTCLMMMALMSLKSSESDVSLSDENNSCLIKSSLWWVVSHNVFEKYKWLSSSQQKLNCLCCWLWNENKCLWKEKHKRK